MKCPKCQFENPDGFKFCGNCTHPLDTQSDVTEKAIDTTGERKHVTIMFSDLSGYTAMAERLDPEEVKEIMGLVLGNIKEIIENYDGFVEKFIGDAVMAVFGVPKTHEDDPIRAIRYITFHRSRILIVCEDGPDVDDISLASIESSDGTVAWKRVFW